jgi:SAM-dependent methyltransferase
MKRPQHLPQHLPKHLIDESQVVLSNLAHPEGFYGEVVSSCLSATFQPVNQWAVSLMKVRPGDRVLEVGFGTGQAIEELASKTQAASIIGVDTSSMMLKKAQVLNKKAMESGKVCLLKADVSQLPEFEHPFDHIIAINSVMYWPQHKLNRIFKDLRSRLAPGGSIYFVMHRLYARYERGDFNPHIQELMQGLKKAGFCDVGGTRQNVVDSQAAIQDGAFINIAIHGTNPAFVL